MHALSSGLTNRVVNGTFLVQDRRGTSLESRIAISTEDQHRGYRGMPPEMPTLLRRLHGDAKG